MIRKILLLQTMRDMLYKDYYKEPIESQKDLNNYDQADYILEQQDFVSGHTLVDNGQSTLISHYAKQRRKVFFDRQFRLPFTDDNYFKPNKTRSRLGMDQEAQQDAFWYHLNLIILFLLFVIAGILDVILYICPIFLPVTSNISNIMGLITIVLLLSPFPVYDFVTRYEEHFWNPEYFKCKKALNKQLKKFL